MCMASSSKRTAKTYGDLRKFLAEVGDPWHPDPTKSDDEPLPEVPTGGDGDGGDDGGDDDTEPTRPARQTRKKPPPTPAPDSGG